MAGVIGGIVGCTGLSSAGESPGPGTGGTVGGAQGELADASYLYASVLPRAIQTAGIIAPAMGDGLDIVTECGLCEVHPGDADGLTWPAILRALRRA